jgi:hypothetical protein
MKKYREEQQHFVLTNPPDLLLAENLLGSSVGIGV